MAAKLKIEIPSNSLDPPILFFVVLRQFLYRLKPAQVQTVVGSQSETRRVLSGQGVTKIFIMYSLRDTQLRHLRGGSASHLSLNG